MIFPLPHHHPSTWRRPALPPTLAHTGLPPHLGEVEPTAPRRHPDMYSMVMTLGGACCVFDACHRTSTTTDCHPDAVFTCLVYLLHLPYEVITVCSYSLVSLERVGLISGAVPCGVVVLTWLPYRFSDIFSEPWPAGIGNPPWHGPYIIARRIYPGKVWGRVSGVRKKCKVLNYGLVPDLEVNQTLSGIAWHLLHSLSSDVVHLRPGIPCPTTACPDSLSIPS